MAVPMLSARAVREIRRQQRRVWEASRAIAAPPIDLILERQGVGVLAAQEVVVVWDRGGGSLIGPGADPTPGKDLTFRRLEEDGFDVQKGDRFVLGDERGIIEKVYTNKGIIRAEARLVTGIKWP